MQNGAEINLANAQGDAPIHIAIEKKHLKFLKFLVDNHCDATTVNSKGQTGLHIAVESGFEFAECILKAPLDIDAKTSDGTTALLLAATLKKLDVCKLLVSARFRCF